jgi:uncharacterized protein
VKQQIKTLLAGGLLAFGLFGPAMAGPYEDGEAAYERGDYATAIRYWRPLADDGNAAAQTIVGAMYAAGQGVPQDYAQAFFWARKAADHGYIAAQGIVGAMYGMGQGVPQDYAQAVFWLRKAADKGNADAQFSLGLMYEYGRGVPQDYVQANSWFNLAAWSTPDPAVRQGAVQERDELAAKMTPDQIAEAERMARGWSPK